CSNGWVISDKRCYIYQATRMIWASAEKHCQNLGGHLISIQNDNDYRLAKSVIRIHDPGENPTWIGLSDCQKRNHWFWTDGSKMTYTKWNPREPNHILGECCVQMNHGKMKDWNDVGCKKKFPFVCA
ncbi:ladderlectin, partial [Silurus asotus]